MTTIGMLQKQCLKNITLIGVGSQIQYLFRLLSSENIILCLEL